MVLNLTEERSKKVLVETMKDLLERLSKGITFTWIHNATD